MRIGLLVSNVIILGVIIAMVVQKSETGPVSQSLNANRLSPTAVANPLDQVSSADIALTVARMSRLPETTAVTNQAQSAAADIVLASSSNHVINKPQVVATALKSSADIIQYITVPGDTVSILATKFGVTSDSIRWSNGLNSDTVALDAKLVIPPVSGIVYTVKAGDTPDSLAAKFRADKAKIIAYNDAEINGLGVGQQIIIPDAVQATTASSTARVTSSLPWGASPVYGYNGYDYGYCTWYVASQISVPANWGNASTWAYYAGMSGWNVSSTPTVGAIAQTPYAAGGLGHVAIVDEVSADGSQIKYRDMNGVAGWGRVGYSDWVSVSRYPHYITH